MTDKKQWVPKSGESAREEGRRLRERFETAQERLRDAQHVIALHESADWDDNSNERIELSAQLMIVHEELDQHAWRLDQLRGFSEEVALLGLLPEEDLENVVARVMSILEPLLQPDRESVLITLRVHELRAQEKELQNKLNGLGE